MDGWTLTGTIEQADSYINGQVVTYLQIGPSEMRATRGATYWSERSACNQRSNLLVRAKCMRPAEQLR